MSNGKSAAKFAPKAAPDLLIRQSVDYMDPDQFAAYDAALRSTDYYALSPGDRENFATALRAANERRQREFNVTITDGNRPTLLPDLGGIQWAPLVAIGIVLLLVSRL